jgi:sialate O-acetylesterase
MKLNPIFSSHMVLQRDKEIRIFGEGKGEGSVIFLGEMKSFVSESDTWELVLPARSAGGPYTMNLVLDGEATSVTDIMIGDVYLLAGQSNAELKMEEINPPKADLAANDRIRFYHVPQIEKASPFDSRWDVATPENIPEWSAIAYYLSASLAKESGVAVGVVGCYQGASVIQSFMSRETLKTCAFPLTENDYHPDRTHDHFSMWNGNAWIHENMFRTILPYPFKAVVWYQGESNTGIGEGRYYDKFLAAMVAEWREELRQPELPFVIVQIHDYIYSYSPTGWSDVQAAQLRAAKEIPGCSAVTIRDLGETTEIHPVGKKAVAARIKTAIDALK